MRALILSLLLATPLQAEPFDTAFPGVLNTIADQYHDGIAALDIKQGKVTLPGGQAELDVPADMYALNATDARYVLETLWGNPPSPETLAMIFPRDQPPFDAPWGIEISFDAMGHVADSDASSINYDDLLTQMKSDVAGTNEDRKKQGFPEVELRGWAEPPHYDATERKLYWAELMHFAGETDNTLNYKIRALGRKGVLQLNFIASEADLPAVKAAAPEVLKMVSFTEGNRYADFLPGTDTAAAIGIGGLIAGNMAAKAGIFATLALFLKKGFIVVLIAVGALWRKVKSVFSRKTTPKDDPPFS